MFKKIATWFKDFFSPFTHPKLIEDLFVMIYCTVWLLNNIIIFLIFGDFPVIINNYLMIVVVAILALLKCTNKNVYNWFKSPLKKEE